MGWLATPIFGTTGNYPECMLNDIERNSREENREKSRLPALTAKWQKLIHHSADFLSLNYYTSRYVEELEDNKDVKRPSWEYDSRLTFSIDPQWKRAKSTWLYEVPQGLKDLLK